MSASLSLYTSLLSIAQEKYYGRELILADRDMVEQNADQILAGADKCDVAFLVVGDPLGSVSYTSYFNGIVVM